MAELQHSQIRSKLLEEVGPLIDVSDLGSQKGQNLESHILSRAVAATAARMAADIDLKLAAQSLVDGGSNNGIDLIYYDNQSQTLYLVQSKWSSAHASSVDGGEVLKFLQGVQDLVSLKKDRFDLKIQARWPLIEDALKRLVSVRIILAYPGSSPIDNDTMAKIIGFVSSQNDTSELFFFECYTQRDFFSYFVHEAAPPEIDLTVKLSHYGLVESPLRAVYGQVSATDIAGWYRSYGKQLFDGNIRRFLGMRSDVNLGMSKTLIDEPDNFWYFNNEITVLVKEYAKQAFGGSDRSVGIFDCKAVTIVNGAQTVGTIGRTILEGESSASVQVRIIVVDNPESSAGREITRASNNQNRIDARNFVALDPEQERIRTELLIDKVDYEFREGEVLDSPAAGFEFIEAITTLACASKEISYVALAKGYRGGLYIDTSVTPYKALFNPSTSSKRLWSLVRLTRRIDADLKGWVDQDSAQERGLLVHGNRLITHCVLRNLGKEFDLDDSESIPDEVISSRSVEVFVAVKEAVTSKFSDAYLAPLFKNVGKCTIIRSDVESEEVVDADNKNALIAAVIL